MAIAICLFFPAFLPVCAVAGIYASGLALSFVPFEYVVISGFFALVVKWVSFPSKRDDTVTEGQRNRLKWSGLSTIIGIVVGDIAAPFIESLFTPLPDSANPVFSLNILGLFLFISCGFFGLLVPSVIREAKKGVQALTAIYRKNADICAQS